MLEKGRRHSRRGDGGSPWKGETVGDRRLWGGRFHSKNWLGLREEKLPFKMVLFESPEGIADAVELVGQGRNRDSARCIGGEGEKRKKNSAQVMRRGGGDPISVGCSLKKGGNMPPNVL